MKTTGAPTKKEIKKEREDKRKEKISEKMTEQEQCFIKLWETWKKMQAIVVIYRQKQPRNSHKRALGRRPIK
jgi:hypothetical protein